MAKRRLINLAKSVIKENQYLSLATANKKGKPWVSVIYYCCDRDYNFYYASQLESVHSKNIFENHRVASAIFNSTAAEGTGVGLQIAGEVHIVKDTELSKAFHYYHSRFVTEEMVRNGPYKLFKFSPVKIYINDPDAKVDKRVEVKL